MDGLTVFWTQTAKRQRDHIFEYWNKRNKSTNYSKKLNILIGECIELLKTQPKMGKELELKNIRSISVGHYGILYKVDNPKIVIVGVWDNRQNPERLLKFLRENK